MPLATSVIPRRIIRRMPDRSLLDRTLAAAKRDQQMVTSDGEPVRRLLHGVTVRPIATHVDARGSVAELFDPRWGWSSDPLVFAYMFTIRPGMMKGWNLHREHEDRYALIAGDLEVVLFDPRPDSPTCGEVCRIVMSDKARCIVNIPVNVWHADRNVGAVDALVVNFPTKAYDHEHPDKYRLPIDTDLIPFRFADSKGW